MNYHCIALLAAFAALISASSGFNDSWDFTVTLNSAKVGREGRDQINRTLTSMFFFPSDYIMFTADTVMPNSTGPIKFSLSGYGSNVSGCIDYLEGARHNATMRAILGFATIKYDDPADEFLNGIGKGIGHAILMIFIIGLSICGGIVLICVTVCVCNSRRQRQVQVQQPLMLNQQPVYGQVVQTPQAAYAQPAGPGVVYGSTVVINDQETCVNGKTVV